MYPITIAAEGDTDFPIVRKVVNMAGFEPGTQIDCGGKGPLDKRLRGYSAAAQGSPWLVLRDLDQDAPCPGELVSELIETPGRFLCLRVAVKASEAWLMADAERLSAFLRVSQKLITIAPEDLPDPKQALVNLARRSRKPAIVADMVPKEGGSRKVGPGYEARIIEFASDLWRPTIARQRCPSLDRCIRALDLLNRRWLHPGTAGA